MAITMVALLLNWVVRSFSGAQNIIRFIVVPDTKSTQAHDSLTKFCADTFGLKSEIFVTLYKCNTY